MGTLAAALGLTVALLALAPTTASAQPLTCGQVITKDTTLHADLGPCPGDGLVIGAQKVTLDLNGHAIVGDDTSNTEGDVGVRNDEGHDGTVIENGEIRDFFTSVKLDGADRSRVSDITDRVPNGACCQPDGSVEVLHSHGSQIEDNVAFAAGTQRRVFIVSGSHNTIANNVAHGPGGVDIAAFLISGSHNTISDNANLELGGIIVSGSRNRVTHNHVEESELGAFIVAGARNLVARNSTGTIENGLAVSGPGNVIRENLLGVEPSVAVAVSLTVSDRGGSDDCRNVTIEENTLHNGMGVHLCRNARIEHNTVASSGLAGIELESVSRSSVEQNTISRTEEFGILVRGGSGNSVEQNTISDTSLSGIIVGPLFGIGGSVGTIVRGNLVTRAGFGGGFGDAFDDGVHVEDSGTVIADNRANDNADFGIEAVPGVIDGDGNTAFGNGNPLQCLNVVCN